MQQVRMDSWTFSLGHTKGVRQASEGCARALREGCGFLKNIWPPSTTPCHPEVRVAYASFPIHTPVSLENEHIVLCRGGQFAEFHFIPSICLMNNNKLEGFTGFQHWAEIFTNNRFSDLTWIWFCLDHLPLSCPCMAKFYVAKLNQSLHVYLKGRKKNLIGNSWKRFIMPKVPAWTDFTPLVVNMTHFEIG